MSPLAERYPHVELGDVIRRVDLHNAADVIGIDVDVSQREFMIRWRAENPLRSAHYGDYRSQCVTLHVRGLTAFGGEGTIGLDGDGAVVDFVEYAAEGDQHGTLRIVFLSGGCLKVTGDEFELRWADAIENALE